MIALQHSALQSLRVFESRHGSSLSTLSLNSSVTRHNLTRSTDRGDYLHGVTFLGNTTRKVLRFFVPSHMSKLKLQFPFLDLPLQRSCDSKFTQVSKRISASRFSLLSKSTVTSKQKSQSYALKSWRAYAAHMPSLGNHRS